MPGRSRMTGHFKSLALSALAITASFFATTEASAQTGPHTRVGRTGVTGVIVSQPRSIVEAVSFKAVNESGYDVPRTSDEVFATFRAQGNAMLTDTVEQVDTGDEEEFPAHQNCIWGAVDPDGQQNGRWACSPQGSPGPIRFTA